LSDYIPVKEAFSHKIGKYLCWPNYTPLEAEKRLKQLIAIGVEAVATGGPHNVLGTPILGKGHTGVVVRALYREKEVALKARRTDTSRKTMAQEALYLRHANEWSVGPKLYQVSKDFIVMERLIGPYYGEWVKNHIHDPDAIKQSIITILYKTWKLDQSGLDHGELTRIRRHIIVTERGPRIIDFESASFDRKPSNLTSAAQSLFLNHRFASQLKKAHPLPDREALISALKRYKENPNMKNYDTVLRICNLV